MFRRPSISLTLLLTLSAGLLFAPSARGQALVVSARSLDAVLSSTRYLLDLAGAKEQVEQFDRYIKGVLDNKNLTGLEMDRPLGLYADWPRGWVKKSFTPIPLVAFIPVADTGNVLGLLEALGGKTNKGRDDIYRITFAGDNKAFLRFAHRHAFFAMDPAFLRGKLPVPRTLIPRAVRGSLFHASLRMDRVAKEEKAQLAKMITDSLHMPAETKKLKDETEQQYTARIALQEQVKYLLLAPVLESKEFTLRLDLDQKRHRLTIDLALVPQAGSRLAAGIRELGKSRSMFANLAKDAKLSLFGRLPVPLGRTAAVTLSQTGDSTELFEELGNVIDPRQRPWTRRLAKALLLPMNQLKVFDFGIAFHVSERGWTWTAGLHVKHGHKMEGFLRDLMKDLSRADRKTYGIKWNHARHAGTRIHKARLPFSFSGSASDWTFYLAIRDNAVLATTGSAMPEKPSRKSTDTPALEALKAALDGIDKPLPTAIPLARLDLAPGWLVCMGDLIFDQTAREPIPPDWYRMIALGDLDSEKGRKLGGGEPAQIVKALGKGNLDKVRATLTLRGGESLRLGLDLHTFTLKLFPLLQAYFQPTKRLPMGK
jgi:hypothetical protein